MEGHQLTRTNTALRLSLRIAIAALAPLTVAPCASAMSDLKDLKALSFEELMNIEITSVSRKRESLAGAASAVQLITREDIRRSGATSIPEALRLAPNLQVAQANASQWAISARGFNNVLANKLLVLIDGRTVYTPLYAGVFWDVQDTLLEDIDRIEVISGPGGTLWGANAVNGVINIVTRRADQTQGLYAMASAGDELRASGSLRYGGALTPDLHFRVYAKAFERDDTRAFDNANANDDWNMNQGGFRLDWQTGANTLTLQSDAYAGKPNPDGTVHVDARGGNLLGRWSRVISEDSDMRFRWYYDRSFRDFNNGFTEELDTYDLDFLHRARLSEMHEIVWGLGARLMSHNVENLPQFEFLPANEDLHLYSAFVQDEMTLFGGRGRITLGTKFEYNDYTDLETQPNGRFAWSLSDRQTLWTAVSRAVRTPSRIDRDFYLSLAPGIPLIAGGDLDSEEVRAYELGWRGQLHSDISLSLSSFFNEYEGLRTAEPGPPPFGIPITFGNGLDGETYGLELAATYVLSDDMRLRGGYTFLKKHLELQAGSLDTNQGTAESNDPEHQLLLQWMWTLPHGLELDGVLRYVDTLPTPPRVSSYAQLDLRLAWMPTEKIEIALVGQNLLDDRHYEFIPSSPDPRQIERSVYARMIWRN